MMTLAMNDLRLAKPGTQNAALRDYDSVRRAIAFISERWRMQPTIEAMAEAAHLTPDELHHLFRRWAGLTPKGFMQALTLDHAKNLLRDSASVLDAAPVVNNQSFDVYEGAPVNAPIGQVVANDPDPGDALIFSITGGNSAGLFKIDPLTGEYRP